MSRTLLALLSTLLIMVAAAPSAQALPVLAEADGVDLAETLKAATAAQGVCYGWNVSVSDQSGGPSGIDAGSDKGPNVPVDRSCAKYVELQAAISFTCESCESEDSSGIRVDANFEGAPTEAGLQELGFSGADLIKDDNDTVLINMVGALPLVTASNGAAPAVPQPTGADAVKPAAGDVPTGAPSAPDWLRENWLALVFFLALALGGLVWFVRLVRDDRATRRAGPSSFTPREQ